MKKLYLAALMLGSAYFADAQVLNQSAAWPNAAWTITGSYNPDPLAFESSPVTTANFAFDDDDAGNSHEDNIAAESPVIDLTPAFTANEKNLEITVDYGYYYLDADALIFQYWNADTAAWVAWPGGNIPGNDTDVTNDFCTITKTTYISSPLSIADFTPTQLAGFKYRISYDDNPEGTDWNYGFCFASPTIKSVGCAAPSELAASNVTESSVGITWAAIPGVAGFEYVLDNNAADPESGTPTTATAFAPNDLLPATLYYFHIRTNCGDGFSQWRTVQFTTPPAAPENDSCATATVITTLPYTNTQDASAATNNDGFIEVCSGMNDGVWYTFLGNGADITVSIDNVGNWDPEMGIFTGSCGTFSCVGQKDSGGTGSGETYTIAGSQTGTAYYVNVGHYSGFSDNAEGPFTLNVTSNVMGTPSLSGGSFTAYPNPVEDVLHLSYVDQISQVAVYNVLGQQMITKSVGANTADVDFSALSQGAYIVRIVAGNASKSIKVIKQ